MGKCVLVPESVRKRSELYAGLRRYFETAYSAAVVKRVFLSRDATRCHVSLETLKPLGTNGRGYPEFERTERNAVYEVERSPFSDFAEA